MLDKRKFYINGKWVDPIEKNDFEVINPCNEDPCAIISLGSKKDTGLFDELAKKLNAPLEISPKIVEIFKDGQKKYGSRAWSSMIVKRMEDLNKIDFRAKGFPDELVDNEPEEKGHEI